MANEKITSVFDVEAIKAETEYVCAMLARVRETGREYLAISRLRRRVAIITALLVGIIIGFLITKL